MTQQQQPQPEQRRIARQGWTEVHLSAEGTAAGDLWTLAQNQEEAPVTPLRTEVFGPATEPDTAAKLSGLTAALPVTWVQGGQYAPGDLGGGHLQVAVGAQVQPLSLDGQRVGAVVRGPHATECWLSGVQSLSPSDPPAEQARETYERLEQALALAGLEFGHVARTWLFLDDILAWYGEFNQVRTAFFHERGIFERLVPASTGIGGSNPSGTAMVAGAYAVLPHSPEVAVEAVPSPLQCPALQYGSSFSRAVEVRLPDLQRLLVSGTASIAPDGQTQHLGDTLAQIGLTCEVVGAILHSRGLDWPDVTRATAYFRHAEEAPLWARFCASSGLPALPAVVVHNVICRDNLLFELEVDAVRGKAPDG